MVAPLSRIARSRAALLKPPPGKQRQPSRAADSNASQNPMNGPKENAKYARSAGCAPAARRISVQLSSIHSQLSGVSGQRIGQVRSERRVRSLILDQFCLGRERETRRKIFQARNVEGNSRRVQFAGIKFIAREQFRQQRTELLQLVALELRARKNRCVGHRRTANHRLPITDYQAPTSRPAWPELRP